MNNAYKQAAILTQDIASNRLDTSITKSGYTQIKALLNKKGLNNKLHYYSTTY